MLNWTKTPTESTTHYHALVADTDDKALKQAIEAAADKAVSLLNSNIQDDSLYVLFEWDSELARLNICVTDASKRVDAPESVSCTFSNLAPLLNNPEARNNYTETVKFWLHDYLTTCTAFFSFSLVAIFHSSTRSNTELL